MPFEIEKLDGARLLVNSRFRGILEHNDLLDAESLWKVRSEPVKKKLRERGTERAMLADPGGGRPLEMFIKRYSPLPLKEYFKSALSLKPLFSDGAFHEWEAILSFHEKGIPTMEPVAVAKCADGTCLLTLGITNYRRASDLFPGFGAGDMTRRRRLVCEIARLAGAMHSANFAHQDFYLVHIFVKEDEGDKPYIIDLQRAIIREKLSSRWRVKDLAQLLFSAADFASRADIMRFWKTYCKLAGNEFFRDQKLIRRIIAKAARMTARAKARGERTPGCYTHLA